MKRSREASEEESESTLRMGVQGRLEARGAAAMGRPIVPK